MVIILNMKSNLLSYMYFDDTLIASFTYTRDISALLYHLSITRTKAQAYDKHINNHKLVPLIRT